MAMLLIPALTKEEADITHLHRDDSPLLPSPSPVEEYKVPPGRVLNANFHVILKGGRFQTNIFSSVDINDWIAQHFFSSSWHRKEMEGKEGQRLERNVLTSVPDLSEKI